MGIYLGDVEIGGGGGGGSTSTPSCLSDWITYAKTKGTKHTTTVVGTGTTNVTGYGYFYWKTAQRATYGTVTLNGEQIFDAQYSDVCGPITVRPGDVITTSSYGSSGTGVLYERY